MAVSATSVTALDWQQTKFSASGLASQFLESTFFPGWFGAGKALLDPAAAAAAAAAAEEASVDAQLAGFPQCVQKKWAKFKKASKEFVSHPIPHQRRPDHEWDHVVTSAEFPNHALRLKSPEALGVDSVKQLSGYLDIEDETKHLFFWFFESRNDPANDPVVLWLNGGPGCSSMTGLLFELGSASITPELKPISNPYSWNNNASVIFLDQPVNVGFSYSEKKVGSTRAAGRDVYAMLSLFFERFPEYNGHGFHISGESYAGHYLPGIATEIMNHDDRSFNLTSMLIGNGLTDTLNQAPAYKMMACGEGGYHSVLSEEKCASYNKNLEYTQKQIQKCYDTGNRFRCMYADYWGGKLMDPYVETGLNYYDIRGPCEESEGGLCYKGLDYVDKYLNLPEVQAGLGVETTAFTGCAESVMTNFVFTGDASRPFHFDVAHLLDHHNVPVLIYAGDKDFICNWVGQTLWLDRLQWSGASKYATAPTTNWTTADGVLAGTARSANGLTFLRVFDAGHMVPHDQPEASLDMLNTWLFGSEF